MTEEKWEETISKIKDKFNVSEHGQEEVDMNGKASYIIFDSPLGKLKLSRIVKPKVLDKKTTYSDRIGSSVKVDYVFSDTEFIDMIKVYKWDEENQDWIEYKQDILQAF